MDVIQLVPLFWIGFVKKAEDFYAPPSPGEALVPKMVNAFPYRQSRVDQVSPWTKMRLLRQMIFLFVWPRPKNVTLSRVIV